MENKDDARVSNIGGVVEAAEEGEGDGENDGDGPSCWVVSWCLSLLFSLCIPSMPCGGFFCAPFLSGRVFYMW